MKKSTPLSYSSTTKTAQCVPMKFLLPLIFTDQEILEEILDILILHPQKGDKKAIVELGRKKCPRALPARKR